MKLLTAIAFSTLLTLNASLSEAGEHAHFAAFFNNQAHSGFSFPTVVKGDNIEQDMLKLGAEMMLFSHSAGIKDGDVWSLQNNTLREVDDQFQDFGVDCELSLHLSPFKVAGLCSVFMSGHAQEKGNMLIAPQTIKDEIVWYKIFEDKENGMAGYFMREIAADFNH